MHNFYFFVGLQYICYTQSIKEEAKGGGIKIPALNITFWLIEEVKRAKK